MIKKALFIFILTLSIVLCSCGESKKDRANELLQDLLAVSGEPFADNGIFYFSDAKEGEIGYFSKEAKRFAYGESADTDVFDKLRGYAGFVSARAPAEIWIFECYSSSDTDKVIRMCLERADALKIAHRNSEWREKSANIKVTSHRKYVLLAFVDNPYGVEKRLKELK